MEEQQQNENERTDTTPAPSPPRPRPVSLLGGGGAPYTPPTPFARVTDMELDGAAEPASASARGTEGDIGGDGYRWRKYGEKLVGAEGIKRSYYKCVVEGCPARKHVERLAADTGAGVPSVAYDGQHTHPPPAGGRTPSDNPAGGMARGGLPALGILWRGFAAQRECQSSSATAAEHARSTKPHCLAEEDDVNEEDAEGHSWTAAACGGGWRCYLRPGRRGSSHLARACSAFHGKEGCRSQARARG